MKRHIFIIVLSILIVYTITNIYIYAKDTSNNEQYCIKSGSNIVEFQHSTFMKNDRIYVSLRDICDMLGVPVFWDDKEKEARLELYDRRINVSDKTESKTEGVIPDEETALSIGKIILEKYMGKSLEYETDDKIYYLKVAFDKRYNGWCVSQTFRYKDDNAVLVVGDVPYVPNIVLSKQTGEVLYINTYSFFD